MRGSRLLGRGALGGMNFARDVVEAASPDALALVAIDRQGKSARNALVAPWLRGAAELLHDGRFDPHERLELLGREPVAVLCMAPGSTGCSPSARRCTRWRACVGWSRPVSRSTGRSCAPGTRPQAYLGGEPPDHRRRRTGDRVLAAEDGFLRIEGRRDDVIISAGYRVGPFEVESALVEHPAVAEAAVVAAADDERGAVVRAIVVLRDGSHRPSGWHATYSSTSAPGRRPTSTRGSWTRLRAAQDAGKIRRARLRDQPR